MADIVDGGAEGVVRREDMQRLARDVEIIHAQGHVQADIRLREHNALALARGAGGVHDGGQAVRVDLIVIVSVVPGGKQRGALGFELLQRAELTAREGGVRGGLDENDRPDGRAAVPGQQSFAFAPGGLANDRRDTSCRIHDSRDVLGRKLLVDGNDHGAGGHDCEEDAAPAVGILTDEGNVLLPEALFYQGRSQVADIVAPLRETYPYDLGVGRVHFVRQRCPVGEIGGSLLHEGAHVIDKSRFIDGVVFVKVHRQVCRF